MKTGRNFIALFVLVATAFLALSVQNQNPLAEARRLTEFGVDAAMKGLWDEASFRWNQAIGSFPNFPAAHNNLAVALENYGEYQEALRHYQLAFDMSKRNRYVESNSRMFMQFYQQQIMQLDERKQALSGKGLGNQPDAEQQESRQPGEEGAGEKPESGREPELADPERDIYRRVGSPHQVLIKHPKRETPLSGKYKRVYIAGFSPAVEEMFNLNFETTEYFRSELRKYTLYDILPLEELKLPSDEDEFFELVDNYDFWQDLGSRVGADLVIYGRINFYTEPADGYYPYEYRDYRSGNYRTAQLLIPRTAMTIELDLFFHDSATGEIVHEESFGQTIVYRGRLDPTLQAFYDVINRILPRFMDILVPREHDAIRFLLKG
ncbi:MAG TPA: tetratricopeptide repeat protein [Acidobacteriota bacterium]|nr:tetratricopeptide repeat protein [Acidobacteriota bacterium]